MPISILIILLFMKILNEQKIKKPPNKLLMIYEHVKPLFKGIHFFFYENNKIITTLWY
jgi:hypothetical protein